LHEKANSEPNQVPEDTAHKVADPQRLRSDNKERKSRMKTFKPGETAPASAQYEVLGPRGGKTGKEITLTKGRTFPPSQEGSQYHLRDRTKNKSGRG